MMNADWEKVRWRRALGSLLRNPCALLPWGRYPLHGKNTPAPFFIVGCGRSGTTLLRRILCAHPNLHIPPESGGGLLGRIMHSYVEASHGHWDNLVHMVLGMFSLTKEFQHFEFDLASTTTNLIALPRESRSLASILDAIYLAHAKKQDKSNARWGDKTPANVFCLNEIERIFPTAQYIHLLRHPFDVVASYKKPPFSYPVEKAAMHWRDSVARVHEGMTRHSQAWHQLHYTQLVQNPESSVRAVCEFLGITFEPSMITSEASAQRLGDVPAQVHHQRVFEPICINRIGAGKTELSDDEREAIRSICNPWINTLFPEGR